MKWGENKRGSKKKEENIERGEIEQPIKPMMRFGQPVFDHLGNKIGIVLLNYPGMQLIDNLNQNFGVKEGNLMFMKGRATEA